MTGYKDMLDTMPDSAYRRHVPQQLDDDQIAFLNEVLAETVEERNRSLDAFAEYAEGRTL